MTSHEPSSLFAGAHPVVLSTFAGFAVLGSGDPKYTQTTGRFHRCSNILAAKLERPFFQESFEAAIRFVDVKASHDIRGSSSGNSGLRINSCEIFPSWQVGFYRSSGSTVVSPTVLLKLAHHTVSHQYPLKRLLVVVVGDRYLERTLPDHENPCTHLFGALQSIRDADQVFP